MFSPSWLLCHAIYSSVCRISISTLLPSLVRHVFVYVLRSRHPDLDHTPSQRIFSSSLSSFCGLPLLPHPLPPTLLLPHQYRMHPVQVLISLQRKLLPPPQVQLAQWDLLDLLWLPLHLPPLQLRVPLRFLQPLRQLQARYQVLQLQQHLLAPQLPARVSLLLLRFLRQPVQGRLFRRGSSGCSLWP